MSRSVWSPDDMPWTWPTRSLVAPSEATPDAGPTPTFGTFPSAEGWSYADLGGSNTWFDAALASADYRAPEFWLDPLGMVRWQGFSAKQTSTATPNTLIMIITDEWAPKGDRVLELLCPTRGPAGVVSGGVSILGTGTVLPGWVFYRGPTLSSVTAMSWAGVHYLKEDTAGG